MSSPDTMTERPASSPGAVTVVTESPAASYRHRSVNVRLSVSVWLDAEGLFPRYAEFSQNEQVVLTAKLLDFTCTTSEG